MARAYSGVGMMLKKTITQEVDRKNPRVEITIQAISPGNREK
jgi:hypothetical protein